MTANDVIGLVLIGLVLIGGYLGLSQLTKPTELTQEEYERRLKASSGMAGNVMNALGEALHPNATKSAAIIRDVQEGHYNSPEAAEDNLDPLESIRSTDELRDVNE